MQKEQFVLFLVLFVFPLSLSSRFYYYVRILAA